jgi:CBS domain-containing protein
VKVKDVMSREVLTVHPDATLKEVAALLAARRITGLPVVDNEGAVLGVVSEADILFKERANVRDRGFLYAALHPAEMLEEELKLDARRAVEAMTSPAITIGPDEPIARAAAVMCDEGVKRLPVLEGGALVGIVTRADLVRAFVRSDEEIAAEVRDDVLRRTLWIDPSRVEVDVRDGVVTLTGAVETSADAEIVPEFVRRVPGVVDVHSQLRWEVDGRRMAAAGL